MRRSARARSSMRVLRLARASRTTGPRARARAPRRSVLAQDLQERRGTALVARSDLVLVGALLAAGELLLSAPQPLLPLGLVDVGRVARLVDEDEYAAVALDLQVALALDEPDDVAVGLVEPQLRR